MTRSQAQGSLELSDGDCCISVKVGETSGSVQKIHDAF